jgi:putative ABC transport system permease protein
MSLPEVQYSNASRILAYEKALVDRVQAIAGVESVAVANDIPLVGADILGRRFFIEGHARPDAGKEPISMYQMVTPQYFHTLGIRMLQGRQFDDGDGPTSSGVAIVDEIFAHQYLSGQNPLGQHLRIVGPVFGRPDYAGAEVLEIVGVAAAVKQFSPADPERFSHIYVPFFQKPWPKLAVAVRTHFDPGTVIRSLRRELRSVDDDQPVFSIITLQERLRESLVQDRWNLMLMGIIAAFALVLAAVGTYGVMSYSVERHTREIGIRMALGAARSDVLRMVLKQAALLVMLGISVGLGAALALTRVMTGFLYEVKPNDPIVFLFVSVFILAVGIMASYVPAWRSTRVDPLISLRCE